MKITRDQYIGIAAIFVTIILTVIGWQNSKPTIKYEPQTMTNSPGGINIKGDGNTVNNYPPPKFAYREVVPSKIGNDGKYHTFFVLSIATAPGTESSATSARFSQNYMEMSCIDYIPPPSFAPKATAFDGVAGTFFIAGNKFLDCKSEVPLNDDGSFFSLKANIN
jgi:hypothetical protein